MASLNQSPGKGLMLPDLDVDKLSLHTRFLIISLTNNEMSKVSPFAIQKALIGIGGEPKSVKRLRSGDLLVETNSALQTKSFLLAKHFLNSPVTISPHKTLLIPAVVSFLKLTYWAPLTGKSSKLDTLTVEYAHTYQILCAALSAREARKLIVPQLSQTYAQAAKSSTLNNSTQTDENITKIKCPPLKLLAPLSSKQRTNIPTAVTTSSSAQTHLLPSISSKTSTTSDPQPPTPISKTKGKIKEQPSQLHRPRKDNIKIDLMRIKPPSNLKKNTEKNTSVKIAREQDSPNETSPVSKKSRRRKTFKVSDAMETDANPSDTDYVTGLASEEDESFLEADFTQVADNPLKGPLSQNDVKDIIRQYHPVCVALQETFLKSCHTTKIRRYGCLRKDTEGPSVSGGVCIFTSLDVPSSALPLHTSLQAVAVRIHSTSLITVCCLYLPPNTAIHQHDLNNLINQLPTPFVILGDFNGHSTLWGSAKTNPRGRQIEQVLSDHCLCLLNHEEPTYFHEPTRSFHTIDLAICSPSLLPHLNLSVEKDLYNSDHFPLILSHDSDPGGKTFPPTYSFSRADWALFTQLAVITDVMVKTDSVDTAVQEVTNVLIAAADFSIPKSSSHSFRHYKPWWNADCQTAYKNQRRLWGIFFADIPLRRISWRSKGKSKCSQKTEKCISPLQSGFRKGRSTLDNLVFLESQIRDAFVRRNHLVSLFFDIEKAYDRTWRYGILRNMYDFGLRGNLPIFIFNFLAVRYFNVRIGHSSSHKFIQDQGVPQGSVLSVTLFNIHMSNILHQLPPSVRGMLYVDDLQVSCQGSDMRLIERQLQTTVNRLVQWCDQNGHTISPSKSSCVHFCRKRNLHPDPSIHIGHIPIPVVSAVRFLGVIFDCKLTFLPHVLYLRKRCERSLNILKVLSNTLWGADRVSLL
ncbi:probable RNA-directed DNA polymerase from transposon X-element [Trichonephila clavipes]|nr:probable RNA-directed DNA polymerase from transposon X-element [Trichonephila clavipes]